MTKPLAYLIFALVYLCGSWIISDLIAYLPVGTPSTALDLLSPLYVSPLALLACRRLKAFTVRGVFITTVILQASMYTATWAVLARLATPLGTSIPFDALARRGGWMLADTSLLFLFAPIIWLRIIGDRNHGPGDANAIA